MAVATTFTFDNTFVRDLDGLYAETPVTVASAPELTVLNASLAAELGLDPAMLRTPDGVAVLAGNRVPDGAAPVAQAYSGHQFGGFSPRLGDGRATLVGEIIDPVGRRRDLHLKGSGRTPFARGGDGKAALGPMLREYLFGEAMHALGIPTTRALSVVATGDDVIRESVLPGAVLARVASSHLRVGTFQYAATADDPALVRRLADYAIARHAPAATDAENPYLALFEHIADAQADLVARWMLIGFIHGVMNTDNVTISGETIDYGPCAFMDAYDPGTVFSSIDHGGRYAYGNQPKIMQWNLARLAETMLPLFDDDQDAAVETATGVLARFAERYESAWQVGINTKLGLGEQRSGDDALVNDLLALLQEHQTDFTSFFRNLAGVAREGSDAPVRSMFPDDAAAAWLDRWNARCGDNPDTAEQMDAVNPVYIPRNHLVEAALTAATGGDLGPFLLLVEVLADPYTERSGHERFAQPAPPEFTTRYQTFCGT